jgi:hypothetical protein
MLDSFALSLGVLAVLIAYLWISVERRWRSEDAKFLAEQAERQAREKRFPGPPSHVSALAPQVRCLRREHFAAVHSRPHHDYYRRGLIAAALRVVRSLSYFRHAKSEGAMRNISRAAP